MTETPTETPIPWAAGAAYIDGRFMPIAEAAIPITDWGYRRSDVTYDVVGVRDGAFFRLDDHVRRFRASMEAFRLKPPEDDDAIRRVLHRCVALAGLRDQAGDVGVPASPPGGPRLLVGQDAAFGTRTTRASPWPPPPHSAAAPTVVWNPGPQQLRSEPPRHALACWSSLADGPRLPGHRQLSPLDLRPALGYVLPYAELTAALKTALAEAGIAVDYGVAVERIDATAAAATVHTADGRTLTAPLQQHIREAIARMTEHVAAAGVFLHVPQSTYSLIRVQIKADADVYPEISASKHRIAIRFMNLGDVDSRNTQVTRDQPFLLQCCAAAGQADADGAPVSSIGTTETTPVRTWASSWKAAWSGANPTTISSWRTRRPTRVAVPAVVTAMLSRSALRSLVTVTLRRSIDRKSVV